MMSIRRMSRIYRKLMFTRSIKILGIETSCDDTGCAIVNGSGDILGESLHSQNTTHVRFGGINPIIAHDFHRENIEGVVAEALDRAKLTFNDIDAISVTTKPGLLISLKVGVQYAKHLAKIYHIPLIPIHHMEAHALVTRMYYDVPFPFLVLLISGGDCILAVVKDVDDFNMLGKTLDNAPGEVLDKAARRMKLRNMPAFADLAGGKAIELAARKATNSKLFKFPTPLLNNRDCNFSFSGLKDSVVQKLVKKEEEHGIIGNGIIPEVFDLCAAFQQAVTEHLIHRTERAILFCNQKSLIPDDCRNIVVSGGVACNDFIFKSIQDIGHKMAYKAYRPPLSVCTDNGIMIAWNGVEKVRKGHNTFEDITAKDIDPEAPLGKSLINEVKSAYLHTKVTRLNKLYIT